jgi:hypothetical protein
VDAGSLVFEGCAVDPSVKSDHYGSFVYYATSKWVTFTTAFIQKIEKEEHVVALMAHELGHYYRAHMTMPVDRVDFFYALEGDTADGRPVPAPDYVAQTNAVLDKLRAGKDSAADFEPENTLMSTKRLGFYTVEQEADEIALELLWKIGISPTVGVDMMLHWTAVDWVDPEDVPVDQCAAMRAKDFRDDKGALISVPVGNISDPHHNFCFRVFNLTRELDEHHYTVGQPPAPPPGDWSQLFDALASEVDGGAPP